MRLEVILSLLVSSSFKCIPFANGFYPVVINSNEKLETMAALGLRVTQPSCGYTRQQFSRTRLNMVSTFETTRPARRKKTLSDRTQEEFRDLVKEIVELTVEAGPRAGIQRSIQAYFALRNTILDFLPLKPDGSRGEPFSAPVALRKLFERLGATYIKLGQFIASSPTLFPPEYVLEFQKCLDATEPLKWDVIKKVIEEELGPISKSFLYVEQSPLASASIAQVHAAKLKTGEDVVIKVQKPRIDESLKADLSFIYVASRVLEFLQPDFERTSLADIAGDIRVSMLEELDFEKEAGNIEEFRVFLKRNGLSDVATAPYVHRELTTKKVLTMERLKGVSLLDADSISQITNDPETTIITALNVWTQSVMTMPWFHADVHAGNLLVLRDGRVGFIDFGIVGRVSSKTLNAVSELSASMAMGDFEGMARALCNMGATDKAVDVEKFGRDLKRVMQSVSMMQPEITVTSTISGEIQGTVGFDERELTQVMLDLVEVAESNGLRLPREFGLLVKQSLYFDRYLKILAPSLDVMADERVRLGGTVNRNGPGEIVIDV